MPMPHTLPTSYSPLSRHPVAQTVVIDIVVVVASVIRIVNYSSKQNEDMRPLSRQDAMPPSSHNNAKWKLWPRRSQI